MARKLTRGRLVKEKVRRAELKECHKEHLKAAWRQLVEKDENASERKDCGKSDGMWWTLV